ncbi:MAG: tetratricopeptide repeat protein, partial [Desulfobacterales bacterium]|nr:tetratricopeptide repeat protein [Desulfobacterales bacterium]
QEFMVCLFLVGVTLSVYLQIINYDFINLDDNFYVTENPNVQAGLTFGGIIWSFTTGHASNWHPLTWLSHMLDCELYGLNPMGHHWTNVLIHAANTILLFLVLKLMTGALWRSAFVAAFFAVHPLHVESVAWVAERKDLLCAFFWMLSVWAYVRYIQYPTKIRYLLLILLFILGLMIKPMLVTLPFVLLLLDFWPLSRFRSTGNKQQARGCQIFIALVWEKIPLFVLSAVSSLITFLVQQHGGAVASLEFFPLKIRIANAFVSYISYIGKMIWPLNLAAFYPYHEWTIGQVVASGLLLLCLSAMVIWASRKFPYLVTGWLWYLGTLFPVIGLVQIGMQSMADRYTYIPLIGIFIILAWGMSDISVRWWRRRIVLVILSCVVFVSFMVCTWLQVRHWQNGVTLFTHAINVTHNNSVAYCALGYALEKQDKLNEAIFHYSKSLQINPYFAVAHNNLGTALARKGNAKEAIYHYYEALRIDPNYAGAYYNLGKIFVNQGKIKEAILNYSEALRFNPNMAQALYNLSWITATHENKEFRDGIEAVKLSAKLCKLTNNSQPLALDVLAAAYAETGRFDEAVLTAQKALKLALLYGPEELVLGLKKRLQLYQTGRPYRQNSYRKR